MKRSFGFYPLLVKDGAERLGKPKVVDNFKEIVFSEHSKIFAHANSQLLCASSSQIAFHHGEVKKSYHQLRSS